MDTEERAWLEGGNRRPGCETGIEDREVTGDEDMRPPASGLEVPAQDVIYQG
jgi:hypothetical protein